MVWQTIKRWYHMLGSPRYFYRFSSALLPWLTPIALLVFTVGIVWGLAFAPVIISRATVTGSSLFMCLRPAVR